MRIILVATDVSRKNIAFVSDTGRAFFGGSDSFNTSTNIKSTYVVRGKHGEYVRSLPNIALKDNLDTLSVSGRDIISYINQILGVLSNFKREHLYEYLIQPKHNIRFAAAFAQGLINDWAKEIDLSQR